MHGLMIKMLDDNRDRLPKRVSRYGTDSFCLDLEPEFDNVAVVREVHI